MTNPVPLTGVEIAAVSGGALTQSVSISATQSSISTVSESVTASNSGSVTAIVNGMVSVTSDAGAMVRHTEAILADGVWFLTTTVTGSTWQP